MESLEELVARAVAGEQAAFGALVERHAGLVWSVIRSYRLPRSDAEDVAQGVWLAMVQHLGQLRRRDRLAAWVATTTRRECLAAIRRNSRLPGGSGDLLGSIAAVDTDTDRQLLANERTRALVEAVADLDVSCRELLALLSGDPPMPYQEVSAVLGIPVGAIGPSRARCLDKVRRHRSIQRLLAA